MSRQAVELVLEFSDELLDDIFERDEPDGLAAVVTSDGPLRGSP